jgi:hypothetical protein
LLSLYNLNYGRECELYSKIYFKPGTYSFFLPLAIAWLVEVFSKLLESVLVAFGFWLLSNDMPDGFLSGNYSLGRILTTD